MILIYRYQTEVVWSKGICLLLSNMSCFGRILYRFFKHAIKIIINQGLNLSVCLLGEIPKCLEKGPNRKFRFKQQNIKDSGILFALKEIIHFGVDVLFMEVKKLNTFGKSVVVYFERCI